MKLAKIIETDVRSNFQEAEMQVNKHMVELQKNGCEILESPRIIEKSSGFLIGVIYYDDPKMVPEEDKPEETGGEEEAAEAETEDDAPAEEEEAPEEEAEEETTEEEKPEKEEKKK